MIQSAANDVIILISPSGANSALSNRFCSKECEWYVKPTLNASFIVWWPNPNKRCSGTSLTCFFHYTFTSLSFFNWSSIKHFRRRTNDKHTKKKEKEQQPKRKGREGKGMIYNWGHTCNWTHIWSHMTIIKLL